MGIGSRVWGLGLRAKRALESRLGGYSEKLDRRRILRSLSGILDVVQNRLRGHRNAGPGGGDLPPAFSLAPETRDAKRETFFDAEFLRKLERLRLMAKRLSWASAKGEHPSSRKGFSLEFADYRKYQPGDDLRYVDWNIYRRLDRLLLKVFTAEEEMNVYLLIDTSRSMAEGSPPKIDYAKQVAAAVGYIGLKNLDRVGGASFSTAVQLPLTMGRGRQQILALFRFVGGLSCSGETNLQAAVHSFSALFPHPGLVVIVSDLFDPAGWRGAFEELAKKRYQLLVIHIVDDREIRPTVSGDVALHDVESGRERRFFLDAELIRRFNEELAAYFREIEAVCAARQMDYLRTTTQTPFDEFVLHTLRQVSSVT
ncbi:MAG TPA: DUF58 domain-containing protein [Candidatus Binatia bacterium]|nr:DUF58 domain-containing protein [Candidatus Binatia bacterium]